MIRAIPLGEREQIWAVKTRKSSIIQIAEKRHGVTTMGSMNADVEIE